MIVKQRRFLAIKYWVGSATTGSLVGPVLVSTSDYRHFHFWDEPDVATLEPTDYEIVKVYRLGSTIEELETRFVREFPPEAATAWPPLELALPAQLWAGLGQRVGQLCRTA